MYVIKVDGQVLHAPALFDDEKHVVLSPRRKCGFNKPDTLTFTVPPCNLLHGKLHKMRSLVTVERGGVEIYRGRVYDLRTDMWNQIGVTCQGELGYLQDSQLRPYSYDGPAPTFFQLLIDKHNALMPPEKHFTAGICTAVTDEKRVKVKNQDYKSAYTELNGVLVENFGGYLRVRRENGVRYLDYLLEYTDENSQSIEFGVNMLDMQQDSGGQNVFSVLIPLGEKEGQSKKLTIEKVNNGLDYLENADAIAKYGRIERRIVFPGIENEAQLLETAKNKIAAPLNTDTLNIRALDKCLFAPDDGDVQGICLGDAVRIYSGPHKTDRKLRCCSLDEDMEKPENTQFVFGEPEKALTDAVASSIQKGGGAINHIKQLQYEVDLQVQRYDELTEELTTVSVNLDAVSAQLDLRVSKDEIISFINLSPEKIVISSARVNLSGYVTASTLSAEVASIRTSIGTEVITSRMSAHSVECSVLEVTDASFRPKTIKYLDANGSVATMVALVS